MSIVSASGDIRNARVLELYGFHGLERMDEHIEIADAVEGNGHMIRRTRGLASKTFARP